MARNAKKRIEWLEKVATELMKDWRSAESLDYRDAADMFREYRDTLISIAQCQNGIASHQAQEVLENTGGCSHARQVFRATVDIDIDAQEACNMVESWRCDCGKVGADRMEPYS